MPSPGQCRGRRDRPRGGMGPHPGHRRSAAAVSVRAAAARCWSPRPRGAAGRGGQRLPRRVAGRHGCSPRVRRARGGGRPRSRPVAVPERGANRALPGGRVQLRPAGRPGAGTRTRHALSGAPACLAAHDRGARARLADGAAPRAVHTHRRAVCLAAAGGRIRRGGPGRVDLGQPAALGHRGQLGLARGGLAAGGAVRFAGRGAPGPGPGGLPGSGGGFVPDFPATPAPAAPGATVEVAMVTASISLRDVGRTFGATRALADVDLDLKPGVTGLLGPNGAGKTTLLRLLATALPPTRGQVSVLDMDPQVPAERTSIRRQLGYQPQEIGFPRGFTAFAFVDYIALLKEWTQPAARHAEVRRVLDLVGLADLGAKRVRAMSGGQRRRVALAQALLGSPLVLILDEPTTGVDPEQRVTLRTVLAEIARTSIVVLSTHQTEDVAALCERVIVLDRGRVRYDGPVTDLTGQAAGRVWLADQPDPTASVSWRTGTGRYRNVGTRVRDDAEHVEPSLEDAYLLLRGGSSEHEPKEEVAS